MPTDSRDTHPEHNRSQEYDYNRSGQSIVFFVFM